MRPQASRADGSWKSGPVNRSRTARPPGTSAGSRSLRKQCPASGHVLMSCSTLTEVRARSESLSGGAVGVIHRSGARHDGTSPGKEPLREGIFAAIAIIRASDRVPAARRKQQRETAARALSDDSPPSSAVGARGQPRSHRLDVVERGSAPFSGVAHDRAEAGERPASAIQVRCGREGAQAGEPICLVAQVLTHAEHVVDDNHPGHGPSPESTATQAGRPPRLEGMLTLPMINVPITASGWLIGVGASRSTAGTRSSIASRHQLPQRGGPGHPDVGDAQDSLALPRGHSYRSPAAPGVPVYGCRYCGGSATIGAGRAEQACGGASRKRAAPPDRTRRRV